MEDDSCVMKYIEIVPRDDYLNVTDIKCEPLSVKVCVVASFFLHLVDLLAHLCWTLISFATILIKLIRLSHIAVKFREKKTVCKI